MVHTISEHVISIIPNRDSPVNAVSQIKESGEEFEEPGSSYYNT